MKKISIGFKDGEKTTDGILARYPRALEIRKIQPRQHQKILSDWDRLIVLIDEGQFQELAPYVIAVENCPKARNRLALMLRRDSVETTIMSRIRSGLRRFEEELAKAQNDYDAYLEYGARDYHFAVA